MNTLLLLPLLLAQPLAHASDLRATTTQIAAQINENGRAYEDLVALTRQGHRLSGTAGAARAVAWAQAKLKELALDRVWLQPVKVPHWTRGRERATLITKEGKNALRVTALGRSPGTAGRGLEAQVIEVHSLDEVATLGAKVRGKIVFYNRAMDPSLEDTFQAYSQAADQRFAGAAQAERFGAAAVLVRSLTTLPDDDHPHTGAMRAAGIPAAAISTHGAAILSAALQKNPEARVHLELGCSNGPDVQSYNVIGELKGSEHADEFVVVGGHLDSWDLAEGAHDDGAGVAQSIEVARALTKLGLRPKRTVRVVLFMSEEFGGLGGREYAAQAKTHGEKHVFAIESDRGGFAPLGFEGNTAALAIVRGWSEHLAPLHADRMSEGESGADVGSLDELGATTVGYVPVSTHYFDYHHSSVDHVENVNPGELRAGAAAMAVLTYLAAEQGRP